MPGKIITSPSLEDVDGPTIFLAGPIQGAFDWQKDAIKLLTYACPEANIANPRRNIAVKGEFPKEMYDEQVDWETKYLRRAGENGVIMFWLSKELEHMCDRAYAQTTRFELGEWKMMHELALRNIVIGIEKGFTGAKYILRRIPQDCAELPILDSLEETCVAASRIASTHPKYNRFYGKLMLDKYPLGLENKYLHSIAMGELCYKIASKIIEKNPEMKIDPELCGFIGYVHDLGFHISPKKHEYITQDILRREHVPKKIIDMTMHGKYEPVGIEGMILVYADMSVNSGDLMTIEARAADIVARTKDFPIDEEHKERIKQSVIRDIPRFKRYEANVLALTGAKSIFDFN
jgi:hypothetical protein